MTETMRWLGVVGGFSALIGVMGSGCVIKSSSGGDGGGDSTVGNGNVTSGNGVTTGEGSTTTGAYGGAGATTTTTTTTTTGNGTTTTGTGMITCDYDANDACDTCFKTTCCDEITACDAACQAEYAAYSECLALPDEYNSNYCKYNYTGAGSAAEALVVCLEGSCYTGDKCGVDVPQPKWDPDVMEFTEKYCVGCHTDHYTNPNSPFQETAQYNNDENAFWSDVKADANWKAQLSYDNVTKDGNMWWCGISKELPADCATMFPGDFPTAQRFPPPGMGVNNLHCWWTADGETCEQPTDQERAMVNNWIFAGYPQ